MSAREPVRTLDELEAIAHDETKALDERLEAAARLVAELDVRGGLMVAHYAGTHAAAARQATPILAVLPTEIADALRVALADFGRLTQEIVAEALAALTLDERAAVDRLVAAGVPVLDALVRVTDAGADADRGRA